MALLARESRTAARARTKLMYRHWIQTRPINMDQSLSLQILTKFKHSSSSYNMMMMIWGGGGHRSSKPLTFLDFMKVIFDTCLVIESNKLGISSWENCSC